jgi:hypothetical protein
MPLANFNDITVWNDWYQIPMDDGTVAHFERRAKDLILGNDHLRLAEALDIQPGQRVVLIGAGFGWIKEDWEAAGLGPIIATDTSELIQFLKIYHAVVDVLDADVLTDDGRRAICIALGGSPDILISEDVLPCLDDSECLALVEAMRGMAPKVAHWVTANAQMGLNSKSIEQWKDLVSPDLVVRRGQRIAF